MFLKARCSITVSRFVLASGLMCMPMAALAQALPAKSAEADAAPVPGLPIQPQPTGAAATPAPAPVSTDRLEEIIVVAQRRSENLQNVPIAVTSLGSVALANNGISNTRDIQFAVPALVYNQASVFSQPFLRGIGSDITAPNADPSVATYVDGVFIASTTAALQGLLGVDHIEVLKGPQGTLYGRNAVGGAINVYTLTPAQELEGRFVGTLANYDQVQGSGYISGGVTDNLALGVYGAYTRRDTYYTQVNTALDEPSHETAYGARIKLVWTPSDSFKLTAAADYQRSKGYEGAAFRNIQPDALGYALGAPRIIKRYTIDSDYRQTASPEQFGALIRADADLGFANFVSLSSFRKLGGGESIDDLDGTSAPILNAYANPIRSRAIAQEFQLLSRKDAGFTWIAGLFYYNERSQFDSQATLSPGSIFFPPPIVGAFADGTVHLNSYSAFGQATVPLSFVSDALRLTVGGRYTIDRKRYNAFSFLTGADLVELPGSRTTFPERKRSWKKFTPKITLDYKTGDTLLYATYSRGFKSGAYNIASPATPGPVNPENLEAYEVGTKSEFLDGRIRLNTSAYFYKFKDIQVQRIDLTSGGGGGATTLQNAAAAEAYGAEATLSGRATSFLTLHGTIAWEYGEYKDFTGAATYLLPGEIQSNGTPCAGPTNCADGINATGNRLQRTPKWTLSAGGDIDYPLNNGGTVLASANWYYNDGYFWDATERFAQRSYHLVNVTMGYRFPGERFTVTAFVKNLTKAYYQNSLLVLPISVAVQDGEPRMYGITATTKF